MAVGTSLSQVYKRKKSFLFDAENSFVMLKNLLKIQLLFVADVTAATVKLVCLDARFARYEHYSDCTRVFRPVLDLGK